MAAPMSTFPFPTDFDFFSTQSTDSKVCVVSIVGKSQISSYTSKASHINPILDRDVFMAVPDPPENVMGDVECFYDKDNAVIYLHLQSLYDVQRTASACQRLVKETKQEDFLSIWQREEYRHAKTLLWMFSVSHIVLLSHPGCSFDLSYVRLFRTLDTIRVKLQQCLLDQLQTIPGVTKNWMYSGRPCAPRVLFVFESALVSTEAEEEDRGAISKVKKTSPIKKLQHSIEDQIYRILRKSRIITNISNNSLFAVPANQEFVYIHTSVPMATDPVSFYLKLMRESSPFITDKDSTRSREFQADSLAGRERSRSSELMSRPPISTCSFKDFLWQHIELALGRGFDDNVGRNPVPPIFEVVTPQLWFAVATQLYNFFFSEPIISKSQGHFNTLKSLLETDLRFSENRCNKVVPVAEAAYQDGLPTHYITDFHLSKLEQAKRVFYQFARGPACEKYVRQLEQACERFWKNGRQLCEEISITGNHCINPLHRLPDDHDSLDNPNLPIMHHSSQLKSKAACNCGRKQVDKDDPFDHKYANHDFYKAIEKDCCDALEHIELPIFKPSTPEAIAADAVFKVPALKAVKDNGSKEETSTKEIETGMGSLSLALSLGQTAGSDYMNPHGGESGASFTTEHHLEASHPSQGAERGDHSVTDQDHKDTSSGPEHGQDNASGPEQGQEQSGPEHGQEQSGPEQGEESSGPDRAQEHTQATSQEGGPVTAQIKTEAASQGPSKDPEQGKEEKKKEQVVEGQKTELDPNASPFRQHSTTEYLIWMINTESPQNLLPKFPSWSICSLGKAGSYNHNTGLDLPGFLHGSNFLLPWDITVKAEKDKWPSIGETTSRRGRQKKTNREVGDLNLRIYLGNEYECPRGHRFFCSGPEKVIKVSSNSTVKDNATKLTTMDMPLYCHCPHCRSTKGYVAQLMRLYIVTPEGPARVSVDPQVQPGLPPSPVFTMGFEKPLELPPGGLWVVRLPHIYIDDRGAYTMPNEAQYLPHCKMLKGVYGYRDTNKDP